MMDSRNSSSTGGQGGDFDNQSRYHQRGGSSSSNRKRGGSSWRGNQYRGGGGGGGGGRGRGGGRGGYRHDGQGNSRVFRGSNNRGGREEQVGGPEAVGGEGDPQGGSSTDYHREDVDRRPMGRNQGPRNNYRGNKSSSGRGHQYDERRHHSHQRGQEGTRNWNGHPTEISNSNSQSNPEGVNQGPEQEAFVALSSLTFEEMGAGVGGIGAGNRSGTSPFRKRHNNRDRGKRNNQEKDRNPPASLDTRWRKEENKEEKNNDTKSESFVNTAFISERKPRNQREVLVDQLTRNAYECMVCCDKVRASQPIWSCKRCFNVFHLTCISKWVSSSEDESGWRCPGCQSNYDTSPNYYYCLCGKMKNPKASRYDVPHTCGQICGKAKPGGLNCTHNCIAQCHPGPCPSCEIQQKRYCGCGKTNAQVLCGSKTVISCESVCNKVLDCGTHRCSRKCHTGECNDCEETMVHLCHCSSKKKNVPCTRINNENKTYSCSDICKKPLRCGAHFCNRICHSGSCGPCKTATEAVISCPCGQTSIEEACYAARLPRRRKCTDAIPTCGKTCQKILPCGNTILNTRHKCQQKCHLEEKCPPCEMTSSLKCRCGSKVVEILCKELRITEEITCQKKCNKKKSCGKHKCTAKCCIDVDHICTTVCQRQLRCGVHYCTNLCHLTPCRPCGVVSFDELSCECGGSVIYPPVPCGTRRPPCQLPCSRVHACVHPVHHPCHSEENCPPCTVLTEKWCHGKHELRKNIMCHITQVSCGLPCAKMLSCGRHPCPKTCHAGRCLENGEICKLPCDVKRTCGHKCGAPCHNGECPESKCKIMTNVNCPCGRKCDTMVCWKRDNEYDKTVIWEYHKEIKRLEEDAKSKGQDFELSDSLKDEIMERMKEKIPKSAVLECDKECARVERNRKLAEALQVDNADVTTSIGTPNYSEFLTKFAKKSPQFIEMVHKQLADLVLKAKQSRKKNETYGFISMNRDKRHVVHEYSDHFGILSESFDEEPNRNVVCFASKEKSYLPSVSLIDAVFRPPTVRSERLKPNDDVTFHPEKRTQIVGPSNWTMKKPSTATSNSGSQLVTLNLPGNSNNHSADFPPL